MCTVFHQEMVPLINSKSVSVMVPKFNLSCINKMSFLKEYFNIIHAFYCSFITTKTEAGKTIKSIPYLYNNHKLMLVMFQ